MQTQIQVTIVPKEVGELIDDLIDETVQQLSMKPMITQGIPLTKLIKHTYNQNYKVHQGKCFQQNSPNLCGYHAIFNTFCVLKMFNGPTCQYHIESGVSFWRFKNRVQNFLLNVKKRYKLPNEWPWQESDIMQGDFERTYNKICLERFEDFEIFRKHKNFYYLHHTWQFQYENLLGSEQSIRELSDKFAQFHAYEGDKPLVLHLMLAITTHWLTFIAIKAYDKTEYWFFDSFNNHYLDFNWEQIVAYIEKKNEDRKKLGKPEMTAFQKQCYTQCMKDVQISLKLIVGCLEGKSSIESYKYNRMFNIFADPLEAATTVGHLEVFSVIREYEHNMRSFFNREIQWNLFSKENNNRMQSFIRVSKELRYKGKEGQYFYNLLKVWSKF